MQAEIPPALLRPSNLWAYAQCPVFDRGDISIHFRTTESAPSEAALRGTHLHSLMEDDDAYEEAEDRPFDVEWAKGVVAELHDGMRPTSAVFRETRVWTPWPEIHGTPDHFYVSNGRSVLIDYKFGQNAYVEKWKWQMAAYLLGINEAFGCQAGVAVIVMPAHQKVFFLEYGPKDLTEWKTRIDQTVYRARVLMQPTPCEACGYCAAKPNCSIATKAVESLSADLLPHPDAWDDENPKQAGAIRTHLQLARDTAEELLAEQARRLELSGTVPEGFGVVNQTRLAVKDQTAIMQDCLFADRAKAEKFLTLPFAAAKKHFGDRLKDWMREGWAEEKPIRFLRRKSEGKPKK